MTGGHFFTLFKPCIYIFFPSEKVLLNGVCITQCLVRKTESMSSSSKDGFQHWELVTRVLEGLKRQVGEQPTIQRTVRWETITIPRSGTTGDHRGWPARQELEPWA